MDESNLPPPKLCPILTTVQIVPRGWQAQLTPIGEAKVASQSDLMAAGRPGATPAMLGGAALAGALGKTLPVYQVQAGFALKTPPGTAADAADPKLIADTLVVPCQRGACAFWSDALRDCRLVADSALRPVPTCSTTGGDAPSEENP